MKIISVVPIKLNNERIPGKNTKKFSDGTPLIQLVLKTLTNVRELSEIYVYCSNPEIQKYFPNDRIKYLCRSTSLDKPTTKINEVLHSFAGIVDSDVYVLAHATAPFLKNEHFSEGIQAVTSGRYDSALAVKPLADFLWKDGLPWNYDPANIPRTQDLPKMYAETSGLYVYTRELIMKENRRIGHKPYLIPVTEIESIDIDEFEDFAIADAVYMYEKTMNHGGGGVNPLI